MGKIHLALGLMQATTAGALFLAWWRSESVQLTIMLAIGTGMLTLAWWTLGWLKQVVEKKVAQWEDNFVTMGETLKDVPRMADHKELERKVDLLQDVASKAATRLEDQSGRIAGIEQREAAVTNRAFDLVERALKLRQESA